MIDGLEVYKQNTILWRLKQVTEEAQKLAEAWELLEKAQEELAANKKALEELKQAIMVAGEQFQKEIDQ